MHPNRAARAVASVLGMLMVAAGAFPHATASQDFQDPTRLLGGEVVAYAFDADDHDVPSAGLTRDSGPDGLHANLVGASATAGRFGDGYAVSAHQGLVVPDHDALDFHLGNFTAMAWVKTTTTHQGVSFLSKYAGDCCGGWMLKFQGCPGCVMLLLNERGSWEQEGGGRAINDGAWHHVAAVREGPTNRILVDGVLDFEWTSKRVRDVSSGAPLQIGQQPGYGMAFAGSLDEVRVFARALTASEILDIANDPYVTPPPPADDPDEEGSHEDATPGKGATLTRDGDRGRPTEITLRDGRSVHPGGGNESAASADPAPRRR